MDSESISTGSSHTRGRTVQFIHRANEFRSTPTAVLIVTTMAIFNDSIVYNLVIPFLPDILQGKLGMSSSINGILFGCYGIGVLIGAPISAYISDRWSVRKWPMLIGLISLGIASVLFAFSNAFWELVLARVAQGVSSGITLSVGLGMVADVYADEDIGKAMGIAFSGFTLGDLCGPVLGGSIYHSGGAHGIAIFIGAITAVDLMFRLVLKEPREINAARHSRTDLTIDLVDLVQREKSFSSGESIAEALSGVENKSFDELSVLEIQNQHQSATEPRAEKATQSLSEVHIHDYGQSAHSLAKSSMVDVSTACDQDSSRSHIIKVPRNCTKCRITMWDLLKEWPIIVCCIIIIIVNGVLESFDPTLPVYLREKYNVEEITISLVYIALIIPVVVVGPIAGKLSDSETIINKLAPYGRFGIILIGFIMSAIVIACLGATNSLASLVVCLSFVGLTIGYAEVPVLSAMAVHVSRMGGDANAKVYALYSIAYSIGITIIPTIVPPIMNAIGFASAMGVVASILALGSVVIGGQPTYALWKFGRKAFTGENARVFL